MSPDLSGPLDPSRFLEDALAHIEPKDEAQRLKLDRLRDRIQSSNADLTRELASIREETGRLSDRSGMERMWHDAETRTRIAEEMTEGMALAWDEHSGWLTRIVAATRKPSD